MRHAVLDTNILVSALMRPASPPGLVFAEVLQGRLVPVHSDAVLAEYEEVLRRPRLSLDPAKVDEALAMLRAIGTRLLPAQLPRLPEGDLPDATDWPFIACALATGCPVVTGNARHFPARLGVRVMTPREWVDQVAS